jgi:hypothetical protein
MQSSIAALGGSGRKISSEMWGSLWFAILVGSVGPPRHWCKRAAERLSTPVRNVTQPVIRAAYTVYHLPTRE